MTRHPPPPAPPPPPTWTAPPGGTDLPGNVIRCDYNTPIEIRESTNLHLTRDYTGSWALRTTPHDPPLAAIAATDVATVRVHDTTSTEQYTPTWAIVLGILLLLSIVGIALFFVKADRPCPAAIIEVTATDGRVLAFRVQHRPATELRITLGATS